ncbi:hypothetical protein G6F24_015503 [Rhizopus arrhizus]|nr:hypothetical protein G6F24_015503 [Rhizopus arrhizus]
MRAARRGALHAGTRRAGEPVAHSRRLRRGAGNPASRWYAAGWIRPIDDMPGLADIQKQMFPGIVDDARATDGRYLGLTYYNGGPFALFRNEKMLGAAGFGGTANAADYPQDWATGEKQAREIKKKGLSEHPMLMPCALPKANASSTTTCAPLSAATRRW